MGNKSSKPEHKRKRNKLKMTDKEEPMELDSETTMPQNTLPPKSYADAAKCSLQSHSFQNCLSDSEEKEMKNSMLNTETFQQGRKEKHASKGDGNNRTRHVQEQEEMEVEPSDDLNRETSDRYDQRYIPMKCEQRIPQERDPSLKEMDDEDSFKQNKASIQQKSGFDYTPSNTDSQGNRVKHSSGSLVDEHVSHKSEHFKGSNKSFEDSAAAVATMDGPAKSITKHEKNEKVVQHHGRTTKILPTTAVADGSSYFSEGSQKQNHGAQESSASKPRLFSVNKEARTGSSNESGTSEADHSAKTNRMSEADRSAETNRMSEADRSAKTNRKSEADRSEKANKHDERHSAEKEPGVYLRTRGRGGADTPKEPTLTEEERKWIAEKHRLMRLQPLPAPKGNVGERIETREYGDREWRAMTEKSIAMRRGYEVLQEQMDLGLLRRIRGDNYCGIRSCLFQFFLKGRNVHIPSAIQSLMNFSALDNWNFARRFTVKGLDMIKRVVEKFLERLVEKLTIVQALEDEMEREYQTTEVFNDEHSNIELMEAGKLLMLAAAVELYEQRDSNLLAMLLFARDTSLTLIDLIKNHLNCIGDTGGIDQLELSLLGYALKSKIRVFHPSRHDKDDFCVVFPPSDFGDLVPEEAPVLDLVAEDDRHYNILLKSKNKQENKAEETSKDGSSSRHSSARFEDSEW